MKDKTIARSILANKRGQGLTEYLILLVLVAVTCIGAATTLGSRIKSKLDSANNQINERVKLPDYNSSSGNR
jgi:Flp pilus assembly pilin Flp